MNAHHAKSNLDPQPVFPLNEMNNQGTDAVKGTNFLSLVQKTDQNGNKYK